MNTSHLNGSPVNGSGIHGSPIITSSIYGLLVNISAENGSLAHDLHVNGYPVNRYPGMDLM